MVCTTVLYRFYLFYRLEIRILLDLQFSIQHHLSIGERCQFLAVVILQQLNHELLKENNRSFLLCLCHVLAYNKKNAKIMLISVFSTKKTYQYIKFTKSYTRIKRFFFIIFLNKIGVVYPTRSRLSNLFF